MPEKTVGGRKGGVAGVRLPLARDPPREILLLLRKPLRPDGGKPGPDPFSEAAMTATYLARVERQAVAMTNPVSAARERYRAPPF
jgi:hypothetical protein